MALPNIFSKEVADNIIKRINDLSADTMPQWGKMNVSQMLAKYKGLERKNLMERNHIPSGN